jgi:hypothetical protein
MLIQLNVGPISNASSISAGLPVAARGGNMGDLIVSELQGRFYENTYRGNKFSGGMTTSALSANTITLTATTTPILGVWNPSTSTVNLVIQQASIQAFVNTLTSPVAPGAFVWASSIGNTVISTGSTPMNRKTLAAAGSQAKYFTPSVALTGLTNALVILESSDFPNLNVASYGTIAATALYPSVGGVQNFDGSLIVPPGGVLALLNTVSTTTVSVAGRLMWDEVPL